MLVNNLWLWGPVTEPLAQAVLENLFIEGRYQLA